MTATAHSVLAPGRGGPDAEAATRTRGPSAAWVTDALLVGMALIWGVNYSVVKFGTRLLAPLAFNSARMTLAAAALFATVAALRVAWPARSDVLALLGLGVLGNGAYQLLFIEGIARSRAGTTALVLAGGPAFVALIGRLRGSERTSGRRWLAIALQIGGIACVVLGSATGASGEDTPVGIALVLAGSLCWSLYSVLVKPYTERVHPLALSALTMGAGAIPVALIASPAVAAQPWRALPPTLYAAIAFSGIVALVVAYLLWYRGVRVLGPTRTAMFANLQPVVALGFAWLALGEAPSGWQIAGGACIMAGLLASGR